MNQKVKKFYFQRADVFYQYDVFRYFFSFSISTVEIILAKIYSFVTIAIKLDVVAMAATMDGVKFYHYSTTVSYR